MTRTIRAARSALPMQWALCALGLAAPLLAFAELSNETLIGPGLRSRPAYDGSASQRTEAVPVVRYLGEPWFVRSTQGLLEGGLRIAVAPGLHLGAQLAYEAGRDKSESSFLKRHHVADVDRGASIGAHLEWDATVGPVPLTLLARYRKFTDTDLGAQGDVRLSAGVFRQGRAAAGVFVQSTFADERSNRAFYGIAPQVSVITGLPAFVPGGGQRFISYGLLWSVELSRDWEVVGNLEERRLRADAAASPLAERVSNHFVSVGLAYRF